MKSKLTVLCLSLAASCILIGSCQKTNDDKSTNQKTALVTQKYPLATDLKWTKSANGQYDIAIFRLPASAARARAAADDSVSIWFDSANKMRLIDQEIDFDKLPAAVQVKFKTTRSVFDKQLYSDVQHWVLDDASQVERDNIVSFKIEVEGKTTDAEVDLYFDQQGVLIKEIKDTDDQADEMPLEIPSAIKDWAAASYPEAKILDYELEEEAGVKKHELDLQNGVIIIEVELVENGGKLAVSEEFNFASVEALPKEVLAKLNEAIAKQTTFVLADVNQIEMTVQEGSEVYVFEFGPKEAQLQITKNADGTFVVGAIVDDSDDSEAQD
ncbi:MAG: PepSY-like domain-containing protein [Mucinivorans sp.]